MAMEIARRSEVLPDRTDWSTMKEMADAFHQSGLLPTWIKNPLAALAVIAKGRELGMAPMYSLSNISMIEGKPAANAEAMAALIYSDHGANAMRFVTSDNKQCTIEYCRRGGKPGQFTFTLEDAQRAGLVGKQNWQKYPAAMLRARAISAVARMAFPDTIGGLYTPEELGAEVTVGEDGQEAIVSLPAPSYEAVEPTPITRGPAKLEPTEAEQDRADKMAGKPRRQHSREELIASLNKGLARARELQIEIPDPSFDEMKDGDIRTAMAALAATIAEAERVAAAEEAKRAAATLDVDDEEF